jgi:hypothetical protein
MLVYSLSIFMLLSSMAATVIDSCTIHHPPGSTVQVLSQYHHDLVKQLALEHDSTIMLIKLEEDKHLDTKKVVFQVTNAAFEMYYIGFGFEWKDGKIKYDTVIQSAKMDVVNSVLGFKKYDQSVPCKNFKQEIRKEFETIWSKFAHQLGAIKLETNVQPRNQTLSHEPSNKNRTSEKTKAKRSGHNSTNTTYKAKPEVSHPVKQVANVTNAVEAKPEGHNKTATHHSPQASKPSSNSTTVTHVLPTANTTVNATQVSNNTNGSKSSSNSTFSNFKISDMLHFVKSDDNKLKLKEQTSTGNQTAKSTVKNGLSSEEANEKKKDQIVKFLSKTFGPIIGFENVIVKTVEKNVFFSESKSSESKTGPSSSVIKAPEEFKTSMTEHGFGGKNSFSQMGFENKHTFGEPGKLGFTGIDSFSSKSKFGAGNSFGDFGSLSGFGNTRSMSKVNDKHRASHSKTNKSREDSSYDDQNSRKAHKHRIQASQWKAHDNKGKRAEDRRHHTSRHSHADQQWSHTAHHSK